MTKHFALVLVALPMALAGCNLPPEYRSTGAVQENRACSSGNLNSRRSEALRAAIDVRNESARRPSDRSGDNC